MKLDGIRPFVPDRSTNDPYTEKEMRVILRRVQLLFFSLAAQLMEYAEKNPGKPPPDGLNADI